MAPLLGVQRKPEVHAGTRIFHTAMLMMGCHNGLYDAESEAAAAVGPRMRLVHLEELLPYLLQILLRNRLSGIGHMDGDRSVCALL